jgi:hypothetical protein
MAEAQERLDSMTAIAARLSRMWKLAELHRQAAGAVYRAQSRLEALDIPSLDEMDRLRRRLARLLELSRDIALLQSEGEQRHIEESQADRAEAQAHRELHSLLADAGVCPTCGQAVSVT